MKRSVYVLATLAVLIAGASQAAAQQSFWQGGYLGLQFGWSEGEFDGDIAAFTGSDIDDDFQVGFTAGYLWDVGNGWLVGPEFQIEGSDLGIKDEGTGDSLVYDAIARLKLIAGREVLDGRGLFYGTAGMAVSILDTGAASIFDDDNNVDWVVGIGYDHRISNSWSLGAEYLYHDFKTGAVDTILFRVAYRF